MEDPERENSYYHPGGVPITPQARRFGYEFPVYVSKTVWNEACVSTSIASKHGANLEQRIWRLLQYCYDGMGKKLATSDDFLYYTFKIRYWGRDHPNAKKMKKMKLGARLFLDPSTDGPWLYIFAPTVDTIDALLKGEPSEQTRKTSEAAPSSEATGALPVEFPFRSEDSEYISADGARSESNAGRSKE